MVNSNAEIEFVSENVTNYLQYSQVRTLSGTHNKINIGNVFFYNVLCILSNCLSLFPVCLIYVRSNCIDEMRTIEMMSVSLSLFQSVSWSRCAKIAERIDILLGWRLLGPKKHCIYSHCLDTVQSPKMRGRGFSAAFAKLLWPLGYVCSCVLCTVQALGHKNRPTLFFG